MKQDRAGAKTFRSRLRRFVEKFSGLSIFRELPIGIDAFYDIRKEMPQFQFRVMVDVGANVGQSAGEMRRNFPASRIYCIEPIEETFRVLKKKTGDLNLHYSKVALGSKTERIAVKTRIDDPVSDRNSLVAENAPHEGVGQRIEYVQVITLKEFCKSNRIGFIDYLKIDTEGFDLEVLKGATELLKNSSIGFVEAEVSMNPANTFHVDFVKIKDFIEQFDYAVFGVYEQRHERVQEIPVSRRSNIVFVSRNLESKN